MSRSLYVSSIAIDRLVAVFGSADTALLDRVKHDAAERLRRHDAYFATFPGVAVYHPLAEALELIVRGKPDPRFTPLFQFEHAAAVLADTLGEPLDSDLFQECSPSFWDDVDEAIGRALAATRQSSGSWPAIAALLARGSCLPIPRDPAWPLGSGFLRHDEVARAAAAADACDLDALATVIQDLNYPDDTIAALEQYREWLRHAAEAGRGLYLHA